MLPLLRVAALVLCVVLAKAVMAQSWPQHTYWNQSPLRLNPASAANLYSLDMSATYRRQWTGLEGAPTTTQAAIGAPVYFTNSGIGFGFERDEVGVHSISLFRLQLSQQLIERDNFSLAVGAAGSYRSTQLDGRALRTQTGSYGAGFEAHLDDLLPATTQSGSSVGFDVGLEATFGETRVGLSVLDVNEPTSELNQVNRVWHRTILVQMASLLPVAEYIDLEASVIAQTDLAVTQTQAAVTAWYSGNIGAGAAFRGFDASSLDAVSLLIGWRPNPTVTLAYSYDYGLSDLQRAHDGSHEVIFRYVMSSPIGKGQLPPIIFNPRQ